MDNQRSPQPPVDNSGQSTHARGEQSSHDHAQLSGYTGEEIANRVSPVSE